MDFIIGVNQSVIKFDQVIVFFDVVKIFVFIYKINNFLFGQYEHVFGVVCWRIARYGQYKSVHQNQKFCSNNR